jgi:hypothetical protein
VTRDEVVAFGLTLPGSTEAEWPAAGPVLLANARPYVYLHDDHVLVRAGTSASDTTDLRLAHPAAIQLVAYEGRNGWLSITLDTLPAPLIRTLITTSHHLAQTHQTWLES